ncbi:MAG: hypothetical protein AAF413_00150 [Patescibacteria group bacterium]
MRAKIKQFLGQGLVLLVALFAISSLQTANVHADHVTNGSDFPGTVTAEIIGIDTVQITIDRDPQANGRDDPPLTFTLFNDRGLHNPDNKPTAKFEAGDQEGIPEYQCGDDAWSSKLVINDYPYIGDQPTSFTANLGFHYPVTVGDCSIEFRVSGLAVSNALSGDTGVSPGAENYIFDGGEVRSADGQFCYRQDPLLDSRVQAGAYVQYECGSGPVRYRPECPDFFLFGGSEAQLENTSPLTFDLIQRFEERTGADRCRSAANAVRTAVSVVNNAALPEDSQVTTGPNSPGSGEGVQDCETTGYDESRLSWIICSALELADRALTWIDGQIADQLRINVDELRNEDSYRKAWGAMRNLATVFIIITAFVMVISTALDVNVFSNYTVKKYLPRLVLGTIFIQLSWVLGLLTIEAAGFLADGIEFLLFTAFNGDGVVQNLNLTTLFEHYIQREGLTTAATGVGFAGLIAAGALLSLGGFFAILALAWSAAGFLFFAWIFLIIRQLLIFTLIIMAPLGISLWILPGSDRAWGLYRKLFFILLYIEITMVSISAIGKIMAWITIGAPGSL